MKTCKTTKTAVAAGLLLMSSVSLGDVFVSSPFRLDMRMENGVRTAEAAEIILASAAWADGTGEAVAEVSHTPPGGNPEILHQTTGAGVESFAWDARHMLPGNHLFTHTIRRGNATIDTMAMTFAVPEPTLTAIRIFGPTNFYSGNAAQYVCMGYFSDDSGRQVTPAWSLVSNGLDASVDSDGVVSVGQLTTDSVVTVCGVMTAGDAVLTNCLDVVVHAAFLSLGQKRLILEKTASEASVNVSASGAWTAESSDEWLVISESSGNGDGVLVVSCGKNPDTVRRMATVTVTCGSLTQAIPVMQYPGDAEVRVTVTFDAQGGTVDRSTQEYVVGSSYGPLPYPTKSGKVFGGWWTQSNGQGVHVVASSEVTAGVTRLFAYWHDMTTADALNVVLGWLDDSDTPWVIDETESKDGNASMRSGAIGDMETSTIMTTVTGPGTLSFWWRTSSDVFDFLSLYDGDTYVDDISGETGWRHYEYEIRGTGTHYLKWTYEKYSGVSAGRDCAWVDSVNWIPGFASGEAVGLSVDDHVAPTAWRSMYGLGTATLDSDTDGDGLTDWEEYVAGSNPTDPSSFFRLGISMDGGSPELTPYPYLGSQREYILEGKTNLIDSAWMTPTNSAHRFFRVRVEMK